jgi:hypothetical protein
MFRGAAIMQLIMTELNEAVPVELKMMSLQKLF